MKRPERWLQAAAILMLLFAAGHTAGFLTFRPPTDAGRAVWDAMRQVRFSDGGASFSYAEFYTGFGLSITASQLFLAWLCWRLAGMARRGLPEARTIAWGISLLQLVGTGLSLRYFSYGPAILSLVSAVVLWLGGRAVGANDAGGQAGVGNQRTASGLPDVTKP